MTTDIEWTRGDDGSKGENCCLVVQVADLFPNVYPKLAYFVRKMDTWSAALITWERRHQQCLLDLGMHMGMHKRAEQFCSRSSQPGSPLWFQIFRTPMGHALSHRRVVMQIDLMDSQQLGNPSDSWFVCHRPNHIRVVSPESVGTRDVDASIRICQPSEICQMNWRETLDTVQWSLGVSFLSESEISRSVVVPFLLALILCRVFVIGHDKYPTPNDGRAWDEFPS